MASISRAVGVKMPVAKPTPQHVTKTASLVHGKSQDLKKLCTKTRSFDTSQTKTLPKTDNARLTMSKQIVHV